MFSFFGMFMQIQGVFFGQALPMGHPNPKIGSRMRIRLKEFSKAAPLC